MFRKGIFFLILTGLLLCAGCAGRRPAESGGLFALRRCEKMVILYSGNLKI